MKTTYLRLSDELYTKLQKSHTEWRKSRLEDGVTGDLRKESFNSFLCHLLDNAVDPDRNSSTLL